VKTEVIEEVLQKFKNYYFIEDANGMKKTTLKPARIEYSKNVIDFLSFYSERRMPDGSTINKYQLFESLQKSSCLVIGLGPLGVRVLNSLADFGIDDLYAYDYNNVEINDVGDLYKKSQIGKPRIEIAKQVLKKANKFAQLETCDLTADGRKELERLIREVDVVVVATELMIRSLYLDINSLCIKHNKPWSSVRVGEYELQIGPTIVPNITPCYECYLSRVNGHDENFKENQAFEKFKEENSDKIHPVQIPPLTSVAANLISFEIFKFLTNILYPASMSSVIRYNLMTMNMSSSQILKIPRCDSCGRMKNRPASIPYSVFLS
jgi:thiazole/oxazole-forming peptide maturase SagC family component